jgi:DNA modification methylase
MTPRIETLAEGVKLYLGDCREILPTLPKVDAVVTDPPYGIERHGGMGDLGFDGFGNRIQRKPKEYAGGWDEDRPSAETFSMILNGGRRAIIWGGNYFSDCLPASQKWLWWDKENTMPSYSDGELAWTNLDGTATKKFVYNGSGLMAKERDREHPTQKPVELMRWCVRLMPDDVYSIVDPFMGAGSTGIAAVKCSKRFRGIEIEPKYFDIACRRISEALKQPDMFIERPKPAVQEALKL